jgi:hypothetical protein
MKQGILFTLIAIIFYSSCTQKQEKESAGKVLEQSSVVQNNSIIKKELSASLMPTFQEKETIRELTENEKKDLRTKISLPKLFSKNINFTENKGQLENFFHVDLPELGKVKYYTREFGGTAYFSDKGIGIGYARANFQSSYNTNLPHDEEHEDQKLEEKIKSGFFENTGFNIYFIGKNDKCILSANNPEVTRLNYLKGNDFSKHVKDIANYQEVVYNDLYKNIDLKYFLHDSQLNFEYTVKPSANISTIRLKYDGVKSLNVNKSGELEIETEWGILHDKKLYSYQVINGVKKEVIVIYKANNKTKEVGFEVKGGYDKSKDLIIDPPTFSWSTFVNQGVGGDNGYFEDLGMDAAGNLYGTGWVESNIFPGTVTTYRGGTATTTIDAVVFKLSSDGTTLIYGTFLGGAGGIGHSESGLGLDVSSTNEVYVVGRTNSTDFPMVSAHDNTHNGVSDIFASRLNAAGNTLIYSTFYGGAGDESAYDIVLNSSNDAYITGITNSTGLGTGGSVAVGNYDAYVLKFNSAGVRQFFTYVGGSNADDAKGIDINSVGDVFIAGSTSSSTAITGIPLTTGKYQPSMNGSADGFVSKISSTGVIQYSTYIGGPADDMASAIKITSTGDVVIGGVSIGPGFPSLNSIQPYRDGVECFLTRFNSTLTSLVYSTYVSGSGADGDKGRVINLMEFHKPVSIDVVNNRVLYTTVTGSNNMLIPAATYDNSQNGAYDYYIAIYNYSSPTLTLEFGTYLGGDANDYPTGGIVLDRSNTAGCFFVGGSSHSTGANKFPSTIGKYQPVSASAQDQTAITKFCFPEILPVDLLYFKGYKNNETNILEWSTASEKNSDYYIVERSTDGVNFYSIGQVKAAGNTSEVTNYTFTDENPNMGSNYYRLKQYDVDQVYHYSDVINIRVGEDLKFHISPNPGPGLFFAEATLSAAMEIRISVINAIGQEVMSNVSNQEKGSCKIPVDLSSFATGMYTLRISSDEFIQSEKLIKE